MNDSHEYVMHYLDRLRNGDAEVAFFALIEPRPSIVDAMIQELDRYENRAIRADIVRCIWEHRRPETTRLLGDLLDDQERTVALEALNGLVAIGGDEVRRTLLEHRRKLANEHAAGPVTIDWLDEAIEQLRPIE
jgi:hypothetical protein